ncbi:MAG: hypothetical protein ACXVR0_09225 [Solirubrobacteraceae bacterium]
MSTGAPQPESNPLFDLLPAVYRRRDALERFRGRDGVEYFPLRTLLEAIAGQVDEFAADIAQVYSNWFIETCDDDLVGYFAELVGLTLGPALPTRPNAPSSGADAIWRRREVADAIADRCRKGSFSVLEQLATDATGWPARAVELAGLGLAAQSIRFPEVGRRPLVDITDMDSLALLGSPLSGTARLADVRRLSSRRTRAAGNPNAVGVWLWRLVAERVTRAPAASTGEEGRYTFDQLGRVVELAVNPVPSAAGEAPDTDLDVPTKITRQALRLRLEDYYGPARSICVYEGGELVPRSRIVVGNLSYWRLHHQFNRVTIDPELGRIAFPVADPPEQEISVTYTRLAVGGIGGGHYERPLDSPAVPVYHVAVHRRSMHHKVADAIEAWTKAKKKAPQPSAVIEIHDDEVYRERLDIELSDGERLEIRAAQGCRPIVVPIETGGGRLDRLRVRGSEEKSNAPPPVFVLNGLWIARHAIDLSGRFGGVELHHCTLVPAGGPGVEEFYERRRQPSLVVRAMPCPISITSSIVGRIRADSPEAGFDPIPLNVEDSVLDSSGEEALAVFGTEDRPAWASPSLARATVLGGAHVHSVGLIEDSVITGPLDCERRQTGSIRYSYIAPDSRTPRRTSCQPDNALANVDAEIARGAVDERERLRRYAMVLARLAPRFDATRFGEPAYARLAADVAVELARGAHDEGELGAYHDSWQALRSADLRERLREFAPIWRDIDIRFAT